MSQQQAFWNFSRAAENNSRFSFETENQPLLPETITPFDLHIQPDAPPPAQALKDPTDAARQPENGVNLQWAVEDFLSFAPPPATPPANIPAWQGPNPEPEQQPLFLNPPHERAENNVRSLIPIAGHGFFGHSLPAMPNGIPAPQPGQQPGPGALLGQVDTAVAEGMVAERRQLKKKKETGPRGRKRKAAEEVEEQPAGPPAKKKGRPGQVKAAAGQPGRNACLGQHKRECLEEVGCGDGCWWKRYWPADHAEKEATLRNVKDKNGGPSIPTNGLWRFKYENLSNRGNS